MGEDEIICDLAETYKILNYRELPPELVATLVIGLSDNSRIKRKAAGITITLEQMLMALMVDNLQYLAWTKTKDAQHNRNRPKSIVKKLTEANIKKDELLSFSTPEEYEAYMREIRN